MISRRLAILAALGVAIYPALPALPASAPDLLAGLDTDHDGRTQSTRSCRRRWFKMRRSARQWADRGVAGADRR